MADAPAFTPSPVRFRVWDRERMYTGPEASRAGFSFGAEGEVWREDPVTCEPLLCGREVVPLLSTGLRDADRVEVWEGDIVQEGVSHAHRYLVRLGPYTSHGAEHHGWHFRLIHPDAPLLFAAFFGPGSFRVIGNVYQGRREPAPQPQAEPYAIPLEGGPFDGRVLSGLPGYDSRAQLPGTIYVHSPDISYGYRLNGPRSRYVGFAPEPGHLCERGILLAADNPALREPA